MDDRKSLLVVRLLSNAGPIASVMVCWILFVPMAQSQATATVTQTLNAQLNAVALLSIPGSVALTTVGTVFQSYASPAVTVQYLVRSTTGGTGGTLTVKAITDFTPTGVGGPSITNNNFTYSCSGATAPDSVCSGNQTISLSLSTPVLTIPPGTCTGGGGACSAASPRTGSMSFSLVNDPNYKTGSYSATLTFTISST